MSKEIEIRIIEGDQKGRKLWLGLIKAKDLLDEIRVGTDIYSEIDNPEGYQRPLSSRRAQGFQDFMAEPKMFSPTTILLNIRGDSIKKVKFGRESILVPPEVKLWIVDGQHRVGGLRMLLEARNEEQFRNMDIPVIVVNVHSNFEAFL